MSWFEQLDLASIVEEASNVINTVNRLEVLNLDEMAKQQEEDEMLADSEEDEEDGDPAPTESEPPAQSTDSHYVDVTVAYDDQTTAAMFNSGIGSEPETPHPDPHHDMVFSPEPKIAAIQQSATVQQSKQNKNKKKKKKKTKKHLNFFGIQNDDDDDEDVDRLTGDSKSAQTAGVEVGFDISVLWDDSPTPLTAVSARAAADVCEPEAPGDPQCENADTIHAPSSSGATSASDTLGTTATFLSDLFAGKTEPVTIGPSAVKVVLKQQTFFDDVDQEVDLENDPILMKVRENKRQLDLGNTSALSQVADYLGYFQQLTGAYTPSPKPTTAQSNHLHIPATAIANSSSSGVGARGIGSSTLEPDPPCTKLATDLRVIGAYFLERTGPLKQQAGAVLAALDVSNVGSVLLCVASLSYIFSQIVVAVVMLLFKAVVALLLCVLDLLLAVIRKAGGLRRDSLELPCSVQSFTNNRQWVREHLGVWASRFQSQYFRTNYAIGLIVAGLLLLSYWQFEGFLSEEAS